VTCTIQKWGNCLAVRIPNALARAAHLKRGSAVNLSIRDGALVVEAAQRPQYQLDDLLKRVSKHNIHRSVGTGLAAGRETW
jgi:antitoxin MazE